jgi:protein required for attachment to host cells
MSTNWFVTVSRARAKVFDHMGQTLSHLKTISDEDGDLRGRDLAKHSVGVQGERGSPSNYGQSIRGTGSNPKELSLDDFARQLAHFFRDERNQGHLQHLILAGEPGFLGEVKKYMDEKTLGIVDQWINKDLDKATVSDLVGYLH